MKKHLGKIYRSIGKVEPEHWDHILVKETDGHYETITNGNNLGWIHPEDFEDGYKELSLKEYYYYKISKKDAVRDYLFDTLCGTHAPGYTGEDDDYLKNVVDNVVKYLK